MLERECYMYQRVRSTRESIDLEKGEICVISGFGPVVNGIKSVFLEGKNTYYNPKYFEPLADHLQLVIAPPLDRMKVSFTTKQTEKEIFEVFGVPKEYLYEEEDNMKMPGDFDFHNKLAKFRDKFSVGDKIWYKSFNKIRKARIYGITANPHGYGSIVASVEFNDKGHYTEDITLNDWLDGNFGHAKKKDELEPGDKFIGKSELHYVVIERAYDKFADETKYFVKRLEDNSITCLPDHSVLEVIYND